MEATKEKENKIYYKVLDADIRNQLTSLTLRSLEYGCIIYKKNKWVKPTKGCGPAAVFDSIENAKKFMYHFKWFGYPIFEVEIKESKHKTLWIGDSTTKTRRLGTVSSPPGTVFAAAVKVIREVKVED